MITVSVDSVRVSLISHHRIILLKDTAAARYLPIWVGPFEADAIVMALQRVDPPRPMTHDLLKNTIGALEGSVSHVLISGLQDNTFFARIVLDVGGRHVELDSRPSDAMALAVRCGVPIYASDEVIAQAGIVRAPELEPISPEEEAQLKPFRDFVNTLDLDDPGQDPT